MVFLENPNIELDYDGITVQLRFSKKDTAELVDMLQTVRLGEDYELTIRKNNGKRSLNANSYHWVLCEKMAKRLGTSKYQVHNQLMCDYGTDWLDADGKHTYILMKDDGRYMKSETMHYRPTDKVEDRNGVQYRWFILLLPSHLMDSAQMAALIDGTVADAREMGVDVRTPDDVERMKQLWSTQA